jgi:hypothetical protein
MLSGKALAGMNVDRFMLIALLDSEPIVLPGFAVFT